MTKFEIIFLKALVILLAYVVGHNQRNKAVNLIDDIRKELQNDYTIY